MKKTELRSLIREEIKKSLNEETTFPIKVTGIEAQDDRLIITIGNNSADLYGYKPKPAEIKKLNSIMQRLFLAKPTKRPSKGEFDEGVLAYEVGTNITIKDILDVVKAVDALKMTHTY